MKTTEQKPETRLVNGDELLKTLFTDESRPTYRWLQHQVAKKSIPFRRCGRLLYFDVEEVRAAFKQASRA